MNGWFPAPPGRLALAAFAALALASCSKSEIPTAQSEAQAKWAAVEQAYHERAMLIPDLTPAAQDSPDEEQELIAEVMDARKRAAGAKVKPSALDEPLALDNFIQVQSQLLAQVEHLVSASDNFPNLDTVVSTGFLDQQVKQTNIRIHSAIAAYNEAAKRYNLMITKFPAVITAKVAYGADPYVYFEDSGTNPS